MNKSTRPVGPFLAALALASGAAGCQDKYDKLAACQALVDRQNSCVVYMTFEDQFPRGVTPEGALPPSPGRLKIIEATQRLKYERNPECRVREHENWDEAQRAEARRCELRLDDFRRNGA